MLTSPLYFYYFGIMEDSAAILALAALAGPVRLKAFRALVVAGPRGLTPGMLQEHLGVPVATLSFHLKALGHAGLVVTERASRNIIYRAVFDHMNALVAYLTQNCCGGEPCALEVTQATCEC
jgi:ArsR family transcriptional regulator